MTEIVSKLSKTVSSFMPILLIVVVILAFVVGILWQKVRSLESGSQQVAGVEEAGTEAKKVSLDQIKDLFNNEKLIKFGSADGKLMFVEVSDVSCPYCQVASGLNPKLNDEIDPAGSFKLDTEGGTYVAPGPQIKKLVNEGKAAMIFLYMPGHGNGELAAKALHCAYEKDKFWEVHDLLMTAGGYDLVNETVKNDVANAGTLAEFLGSAIDSSELKTCLESGKYDSVINEEPALAMSLGVGGTPAFFVNENLFAGAYSFSEMEPIINQLLGE